MSGFFSNDLHYVKCLTYISISADRSYMWSMIYNTFTAGLPTHVAARAVLERSIWREFLSALSSSLLSATYSGNPSTHTMHFFKNRAAYS